MRGRGAAVIKASIRTTTITSLLAPSAGTRPNQRYHPLVLFFILKFIYTLSMPIFSWSIKRQLIVFVIFAIFVFLIVGGGIYFLRPESTCFDNRQNQDEEDVDCGGIVARCTPCAGKIREMTILWTRFFQTRPDTADVGAFLENQNQFLNSKKLVYAVKLYDASNVLIAIKENSTFVNAGEKFLIFEPSIAVGNRVPKRAVLDLKEISWESGEPAPLRVEVLQKEFISTESDSHLEIKLKNQANFTYKNIEISALLSGRDDQVLGISKTIVGSIGIGEENVATLTWPQVIEGVERSEVFLRQMP